MMRKLPGGRRGAMSAQTLFLAGAGILVVAAVVFVWARHGSEEKKREHIGQVGLQSTFKLGRHAGINLPIADHAEGVTAPAETTVEVPLDWGKDPADAERKLASRYADVSARLSRPEGVQVYGETITLKVDRDLEYRSLVQAVLAGQQEGFLKFRILCQKAGDEKDLGCLNIELPTDVPVGKNVLLFRMFQDGAIMRYIFGVSRTREYVRLKDAAAVMKNTVESLKKGDPQQLQSKILVVSPSITISVQNVVEGLNAATYAGFERITLGRPAKLY